MFWRKIRITSELFLPKKKNSLQSFWLVVRGTDLSKSYRGAKAGYSGAPSLKLMKRRRPFMVPWKLRVLLARPSLKRGRPSHDILWVAVVPIDGFWDRDALVLMFRRPGAFFSRCLVVQGPLALKQWYPSHDAHRSLLIFTRKFKGFSRVHT